MKTKLYELRIEKNIAQSDLAEILEVTRQAYSRYERGERELGYEALKKLSKFFDVSIDYLLENSTYYYPDRLAHTNAPKSDEDREILSLFHALTPEYRAVALKTLRSWAGVPATGVSKKKA